MKRRLAAIGAALVLAFGVTTVVAQPASALCTTSTKCVNDTYTTLYVHNDNGWNSNVAIGIGFSYQPLGAPTSQLGLLQPYRFYGFTPGADRIRFFRTGAGYCVRAMYYRWNTARDVWLYAGLDQWVRGPAGGSGYKDTAFFQGFNVNIAAYPC
jgi:hypothetical protein